MSTLVARCTNYREDIDQPCTGTIRYSWGMIEAACDTCGGRCGVAVAPWIGVEACSTLQCPGDARYAAPGRGHVHGCRHPSPAEAQQDDEPAWVEPFYEWATTLRSVRPDSTSAAFAAGWAAAIAARPSADTETLRDALRLIAGPAPHCSNSTTERHACRQPASGRTRGAQYGADAWCDQCIARGALDGDR